MNSMNPDKLSEHDCKLEVYKLWLGFLEKLILLIIAVVIIPLVIGRVFIPSIIGVVWAFLVIILVIVYIFISFKLRNLWKTLSEGE